MRREKSAEEAPPQTAVHVSLHEKPPNSRQSGRKTR